MIYHLFSLNAGYLRRSFCNGWSGGIERFTQKGFERGLSVSGDDVDLAEMYPGLIVESILAALPNAADLAANEGDIEVNQLSW